MNKIPEFTVAEIPDTIAYYRSVIIRGLLDGEQLETEIAAKARHQCEALFLKKEIHTVPDFWTLNREARAVAPQAAEGITTETPKLQQLLEQSKLSKILRQNHNYQPKVEGGRLRYQMLDRINHPLHQDLMFHHNPSFFTCWMPMMPTGIRTNVDCPGVTLFYPAVNRALAWKTKQPPEVSSDDLEQFRTHENLENDFHHPNLELGDALLFRETVPHAGFIPTTARMPRTSFDYRLWLPFKRAEHLDYMENA